MNPNFKDQQMNNSYPKPSPFAMSCAERLLGEGLLKSGQSYRAAQIIDAESEVLCAICGMPCCAACSWHYGRSRYECSVCEQDGLTKLAIPNPMQKADLAHADWEGLERDVVLRIRLLKATFASGKGLAGPLADKIAQDLVLPNLRLLAAFCAAVQVDEYETKEGAK